MGIGDEGAGLITVFVYYPKGFVMRAVGNPSARIFEVRGDNTYGEKED